MKKFLLCVYFIFSLMTVGVSQNAYDIKVNFKN
ncbi:MAG: hypothetical protein K0S12_998, partial [Bacteroidetes bacterium]|nr:hypothetical protein [Bacteroidota bacterium]